MSHPPTDLTQDDSTMDGPSRQIKGVVPESKRPCLALIWSADEPHRVGQIFMPPSLGQTFLIGKGPSRQDDMVPRLQFMAHRPFSHTPTGYIQSPFVSRRQLRVLARDASSLHVHNVGKRRLVHNHSTCEEAIVEVGDIVGIHNHYLFLCVSREKTITAPTVPGPAHRFAAADAVGMVGESAASWELRRILAWVAKLPNHVLLLGESGSGKEMAARAIHQGSARAEQAYIPVDAGAIPESLFEAELYGNKKNFPQAGMPESEGLVGMAKAGSLFLDELGNVPISCQQKLLRLLDPGSAYRKLGDNKISQADIRVIAATNVALNNLKFDVGARLQEHIQVCGLNQRREDIPLIANRLLAELARKQPLVAQRFFQDSASGKRPRFAQNLMHSLVTHQYKTHVRELDGLLTLAMRDSASDTLELTSEVESKLVVKNKAATYLFQGNILPLNSDPLMSHLKRHDMTRHTQRLQGLRKYGFHIPSLVEAEDYPVRARQQVMDHIRILLCISMKLSKWTPARAIELATGPSNSTHAPLVQSHLNTLLKWCRGKLEQYPDRSNKLDEWVKHHFRREAPHVIDLLSALKNAT